MNHAIPRQRLLVAAFAAAALLTAPAWAGATTTHYATTFTTLNSSHVTGSADVTFNSSNNMLTVHINATGLMPNEMHPQHIHGMFANDQLSGTPAQSTTPSLAQDANGDGVIELGEGQTTYGPILIPLTLNGVATGPFSTTPSGTLDYTQTFDLTNPDTFANIGMTGSKYTESDLFPLNFREIVLHGLDAPKALTDGGVSYAKGEYDPVLPIASGVLMAAVPEPADFGMMAGGLGLLLGFLWLRRKDSLQREEF